MAEVDAQKLALIQRVLDDCNAMDRCATNLRRLATDFHAGRITAAEFEADRNRYLFERDHHRR